MKLEELIYKRFAGSENLIRHLAVYMESPAVFWTEPPGDVQDGWNENVQYPKIIYNYDMQANEERRSAGILSVSLLCRNSDDAVPEDIEPFVRECLRDVVLTPLESGIPYCFAWARTEGFTIEDKTGETIGSEIRFDILEYPSQETTDPDPVAAANKYIKGLYPHCLVMGYDKMEETEEASAERPVIYCRLLSVERAQETYTVAWMDGRIAVHILCPDSSIRMKMAADIVNRMAASGEIVMLDHSPMRLKRLQADYRSDYLKNGQIYMTVHYGILKGRPLKKAMKRKET